MEKTISPEERIRRAEEIYYRRKLRSNNVRMSSSQVKEENGPKQFSLYKKMVLQILICILIYLIFSLIKEANYLFSEDVINKTKELLSTDMNFQTISSQVGQFFQNNQDKWNFFSNWWNGNQGDGQEPTNTQNEQQNVQGQNQNNEQTENVEQNIIMKWKIKSGEQSNQKTSNNESTGIGGGEDETIQASAEGASNKTQMEIDAEYIKENFKLQLPVEGEITSPYGKREPTDIITENHQGIDIGVVTGTTIVAAMEGTVSLVSDEGSYGIHVKIVNKDVTTIYAHCSKILVKEGDTIKKGQKIALSGNTGNTTGPHLHFEIRRENRTVNPELVLNWK